MKKLISLLLILCVAVCCAEGVYDALPMSLVYDGLAEYGEPADEGEYIRTGDALLSFYDSGRLRAKTLYFENVADVAAETDGDFSSAEKLKQGAELSELTDLLGEGREIMYINLADEDNPGSRRVLAWKNAEGKVLEALIETDDGHWILFALSEIRTKS